MFKTMAVVIGALCSAAPAIAAGNFYIPVDERFGTGKIDLPGYGKGYIYRMIVIDHEGTLAVCGAGYFADASSAVGMRRLMRKTAVLVNGRTLIRDLSFFTQVKSEAALNGASAACVTTGFPTPRSDDVEIDVSVPSGFVRF